MKKQILAGLLALSTVTLTLASCTTVIEKDVIIQKEESELTKHIKELRKGVAFEGTFNQSRVFYDDSNFTKPSETQPTDDVSAQANIKFGFTEDAFYRYVATVLEGEEVPCSEDIYVKDEDGYAYKEYLSYENKVEKNYQMSYDNKCSFVNLGYGNPFNSISENDLTYDEATKSYSLDLDKASEIWSTLLSFYAAGIVNTPKSCTIKTNDKGEFTSLSYVLNPRKVVDYNSMTDTTTYYITEQNVQVVISTIEDGSIVDRLTPIKGEESTQISKLDTALKSFNGENVFVQVIDQPEEGTESYRQLWYDGKSAYVKQFNSLTGGTLNQIDPGYDYILAQNEAAPTLYEARGYDEATSKWVPSNNTKFGKTSQDKYRYSDLILDFSKISTDLFKYDKKTASFVCDNIAAGDVANKGLQPKARELANSNLAYTDKISITLSGDRIDRITAHYSYYNYFTSQQIEGEVKFSFRNMGKTTLPFDSKVESIGGTK